MQLNVACLLKYCIYVWCKIVLIIIINFIINLINNSIFVRFKSQNSQFNQRSCESCYQIITFFSVKHRLTGWLSVLPITRWAAVANIVFLASAVCVCVCVSLTETQCVFLPKHNYPLPLPVKWLQWHRLCTEAATVCPILHGGYVCVCVCVDECRDVHTRSCSSVRACLIQIFRLCDSTRYSSPRTSPSWPWRRLQISYSPHCGGFHSLPTDWSHSLTLQSSLRSAPLCSAPLCFHFVTELFVVCSPD